METRLEPDTAGRMWVDLFLVELDARNAQHQVTRRALIYADCGMATERICDALKLTEPEWAMRVLEFRAHEAANRAAHADHAARLVAS